MRYVNIRLWGMMVRHWFKIAFKHICTSGVNTFIPPPSLPSRTCYKIDTIRMYYTEI